MEILLDTCGRRATFLLLLHLFVVKAAADCPKPQGRENIVLTNEALLMNNFPNGVSVTLECANGYVIESGSGIMTCVDKDWTELDLTCKKKDCGPPKPKPNMSFDISAGTLFGAVIRVVCDKGFQVSGSSYKQCYAFGWSGRANCETITCDKPGNVTNGRSIWDSQDDPKYGEIIYYVCNEGYTLVGENSFKCGETDEYDPPLPACIEMTTTSTSPAQEVSTSTASSATPTAHRDTTVTSSETPTVSPSVRGGGDILTTEGKATTTIETSMASSSLPGNYHGAVDTNKDVGYMPVIVSVLCVSLVVCIVALFLHKFLLRRKGSYDTREDLKPELLQFQNL